MSETQDDSLETRPRRGQQPKEVTQQMRTQVQSMTGYGIPQLDIARLMQMDVKTLRKHFREELDTGMTRANMLMAEALWKNGVRHNNVQAQIWWTKARMGWKDQSQLDVTGVSNPIVLHLFAARAVSDQLGAERAETPVLEAKAEVPSGNLLDAPLPTE